MIVLVESHPQERATRQAPPSAPDAGARWGRASGFDFDRSDESAEMENRGGIILKWPAERIETVAVADLTPVWRSYDVVRVPSSADPTKTVLGTVTREMLIPLGSSTQRYVGGGVGYVEDPGMYVPQPRVIHSYVRLAVPSPLTDFELVDSGTEGAWPDYPDEMFTPGGGLVPIMPSTVNWTR